MCVHTQTYIYKCIHHTNTYTHEQLCTHAGVYINAQKAIELTKGASIYDNSELPSYEILFDA